MTYFPLSLIEIPFTRFVTTMLAPYKMPSFAFHTCNTQLVKAGLTSYSEAVQTKRPSWSNPARVIGNEYNETEHRICSVDTSPIWTVPLLNTRKRLPLSLKMRWDG